MTDRTVHEEGNGTAAGRTVREGASVVGTIREDSGATMQEGGSGRTWLPAALGSRFKVIEELPTRGMEADLLIIGADDGRHFLAKIYRRGIKPKEEILRLLKQAQFEHVVHLEEFGEENGIYWELMEYIQHSSLRALIDQEGPRLPNATVKQILRELNDALAYLHGLPIEHRDLKPDNVLVRTREPIDLVLADFGIASLMDASVRETSAHRTISYAPPEAIGVFADEENRSRSNVAVVRTRWDYWSLGMILVELLTGEHPFKGRSEAVIAHRIATQNVDDLVLGIEDEGWRKLCRGLLRRDPRKRWGSEQLNLWLANEHDHRLTVADEIIPTAHDVRGIDFDGRVFVTTDSLGLALSQDWTKATSLLERRQKEVETWLFDKLGRPDLGQALQEIDKDALLSLDARIFLKIYLLVPSAPLRFRDVDLTIANIKMIAERAFEGDRDTSVTLLAIYESGILPRSVKLVRGNDLAEIERGWKDAVNDYRTKQQDVERNGAWVPALEGDVLVQLLAAAVPVPSIIAQLSSKAEKATTSFARECSWFRNLGGPANASISANIIIPYVIREAEVGERQRQRNFLVKEFPKKAFLPLGISIVSAIGTIFNFSLSPEFWDKTVHPITLTEKFPVIAALISIAILVTGFVSKFILGEILEGMSVDLRRAQEFSRSILRGSMVASLIFLVLLPVSFLISMARYDSFEINRLSNISISSDSASFRVLESPMTFMQGAPPRISFQFSGNVRDRDHESAALIGANSSTPLGLQCEAGNCTIAWPDISSLHGDFLLEISYAGTATLTTIVSIIESFAGRIVWDQGVPSGEFHSFHEDRWTGFDVIRGHCVQAGALLLTAFGSPGTENERAYFRSESGTITARVFTVPIGGSTGLGICSTRSLP